eukprot:CAMPEP_0171916750 /NCGR_PEP_ID=MMETSP0993-20121228/15242_1 /TAXON_ID=483369 /ORGANISM="non described non described, Strain CCMP2098" /LENGTH=51 /DNA_ID=CAMNT_0012552309 /DNA_START=135 /DNA_END=286 /DNA_ORIENTATION=-
MLFALLASSMCFAPASRVFSALAASQLLALASTMCYAPASRASSTLVAPRL